MKTLILSTVAAAVIALSAGTAFAGGGAAGGHTDHGADIMLQSLGETYATSGNQHADRQFLSGQTATDQVRAAHNRGR